MAECAGWTLKQSTSPTIALPQDDTMTTIHTTHGTASGRSAQPGHRPTTTWRGRAARRVQIKNDIVREVLAEFLGTFVLIAFGDAVVAQVVLSKETAGQARSIHIAWGIAVMMAVYVSGGVSGGHVNPAVSLSMAVLGRLPAWKAPLYMLAQYLGAIVASACIFAVYHDALNAFDGGVRKISGDDGTAGIWATYPQQFLTNDSGLLDQVFGTGLLLIGVLAITDKKNMDVQKGILPIAIGFLVMAIGMCYGFNCGYAINPARDLGPRIFTMMAGWTTGVFTASDNWFWIPVAGPYVGGLLGTFVYQIFVGVHLQTDEDEDDEDEREDHLKTIRQSSFSDMHKLQHIDLQIGIIKP